MVRFGARFTANSGAERIMKGTVKEEGVNGLLKGEETGKDGDGRQSHTCPRSLSNIQETGKTRIIIER